MTSIERVKAAIRFEKTDRVPVIPEVAGVTARLMNKTVRDYVTDGALIAECQLAGQEFFQYDAVIAFADLCVEAEAIGCEVAFPENNYPYITKPILNSIDGLADLVLPDPRSSGRMPELIKAVKAMRTNCHGRIPVVAHVLGPLTIASRIMDIEKMLYMVVDEPESFKSLLSYTLDVSLGYARALLETGADCIIMFDPSASPAVFPPRLFREFELPNLKRIFSFIKQLNPEAITWYSVAGATQEIIKDLERTDLDILTVDYLVPLNVAFELSSTLCFNGNIKSLSFTNATPDEIYETSTKLLEISLERGGFILGAGCEVPPDANMDNIRALTRASSDMSNNYKVYGRKNGDNRCITFYPFQKRVYIDEGTDIVDAAIMAGLTILRLCNKEGVCGSCIVRVEKGASNKCSEREKLVLTSGQRAKGYRLACQLEVSSDMTIFVPRESRVGYDQRVYLEGRFECSIDDLIKVYPLNPRIEAVQIPLKRDAANTGTDLDLILSATGKETEIRPELLRSVTGLIRNRNKKLYGIMDKGNKRLLDLTGSPKTLGVALDLGTTTIAVYCHDLATGEFIGSSSALNPQLHMGADVMTRAENYIADRINKDKLRHILVNKINRMILNTTRDAGLDYNCIYQVVVVGNAVMHHMFLGLDLAYLVKSPFIPVITSCYDFYNSDIKASERLAMNKNGMVTCPPILGGFIGSDITVGILSSGLHRSKEITLYIDLGTNGEIVLGNRERIISTSIAAGPAFEQSHLSGGRVAGANVIYEADIDDEFNCRYKTVDGGKPSGYCGSALIDIVASFLRLGIIDSRGKFVENIRCRSLTGNHYLLLPRQETAFFEPIVITAKDIEEVQKAKGAIKAAITVITKRYGITLDRIDRVICTGTFGMSLRVENAVRIGLIPGDLKDKVEFIPNGAGAGARLYLLSEKAVSDVDAFIGRIDYIHVAEDNEFNNIFIDSMMF